MVVFYCQIAAEEELILIHKRWSTHYKEELANKKKKKKKCTIKSTNHDDDDDDSSAATRRQVTFRCPEVTTVHKCPHHATPLDKEACYYDRRDRYMFEQDRIETALAYEACLKQSSYSSSSNTTTTAAAAAATTTTTTEWLESNVQTVRGLEDFFAPTSKEDSRRLHVHAVLRAAARIKHEGYIAPDAFNDTLRYISSESSAWARQRAHALGLTDAQAVQAMA